MVQQRMIVEFDKKVTVAGNKSSVHTARRRTQQVSWSREGILQDDVRVSSYRGRRGPLNVRVKVIGDAPN